MKKTRTEEEIDAQLSTFERLLTGGSNILLIAKEPSKTIALVNKHNYDDETQISRKMIEQGLVKEVRVMNDKESEEKIGTNTKTEKREGISIFIPFYREMGAYMRYALLLPSQKHKGGTKSYVFPSKNQWTVRMYLKYWWLKLLQRKLAVCDGVDDQKEIQEAIDNTADSGIIIIEGGEYDMTGEIVGNATITGTPKVKSSRDALPDVWVRGRYEKGHRRC